MRLLSGAQAAAGIVVSALLASVAEGYQVLISDEDLTRQVCSGMWQKLGGTRDPYIEILFGPASRGQLAMVIYEWEDAKYLGIDETDPTGENDWDSNRVYVCTLDAVSRSLCSASNLGQFITTMPNGTSVVDTSIWTKSIQFNAIGGGESNVGDGVTGPYRYNVTKTGYYCVGAVPLTAESPTAPNGTTVSSYTGVVDFENVFKGMLPAGEYPKVAFYGALFFIYLILGGAWAWNYWRHRDEILSVQKYISATVAFLVVEMATVSVYYKYVNDVGHPTVSHAFLVLVSVLSAARNAISFFMLLLVSLGYGIVKPSLGGLMIRVRILAVLHFVFGVMYSIGMVIFPFETAGLLVFIMVFPLAFTLTGFMMWIMAALSTTIQDLDARNQTFKKQMFTRLYRILIGAAIVIVAFFVISSISFSNRLDSDFAPETWRTRWFLVDGWLGLLYLVCFAAIAYLWRPTERNQYLAMSDEIAQDEDEADEYDVRALVGDEEDADAEGKWGGNGDSIPLRKVGNDSVVFDIGDDDEDDDRRRSRGGGREENQRLRRSSSTERPRGAPPAYD